MKKRRLITSISLQPTIRSKKEGKKITKRKLWVGDGASKLPNWYTATDRVPFDLFFMIFFDREYNLFLFLSIKETKFLKNLQL